MGPGLEVTGRQADPWGTAQRETRVHPPQNMLQNVLKLILNHLFQKNQAFTLVVRLPLRKVSLDNLGVCGKGVPLVAGSSIFP